MNSSFSRDSRAMRQQIKTDISGEFELSRGVTRHMTGRIAVQTFPQLSLSLDPWHRLVAFQKCDSRNGGRAMTRWVGFIKKEGEEKKIPHTDFWFNPIITPIGIHRCHSSKLTPYDCILTSNSDCGIALIVISAFFFLFLFCSFFACLSVSYTSSPRSCAVVAVYQGIRLCACQQSDLQSDMWRATADVENNGAGLQGFLGFYSRRLCSLWRLRMEEANGGLSSIFGPSVDVK